MTVSQTDPGEPESRDAEEEDVFDFRTPAAHLPPIATRMQSVYEIEFAPDGYPLRHGIANPIIETVVICHKRLSAPRPQGR